MPSHEALRKLSLELAYNQMMLRLRENAVNELTLREGTLQAQLSALQTQINPHFIYNTLNIISAKSMDSGNLEIIEICDQFASMLRYSTDTRSRTATIQEEIENVRNYLLLAKARYEDNLEFVIHVPDGLNDIIVPKLTLQPLVENALTHGFDGKNILRRLSIIGTLTDLDITYRGLLSKKSRRVNAFVYIMHEDRPFGIPSHLYVNTCLQGYADFGFDEEALATAYAFSKEEARKQWGTK